MKNISVHNRINAYECGSMMLEYVLMLSVRQPGDSGVVAERLLKGWKASGLSSSMRIDISTGLPEPIV